MKVSTKLIWWFFSLCQKRFERLLATFKTDETPFLFNCSTRSQIEWNYNYHRKSEINGSLGVIKAFKSLGNVKSSSCDVMPLSVCRHKSNQPWLFISNLTFYGAFWNSNLISCRNTSNVNNSVHFISAFYFSALHFVCEDGKCAEYT